MSRRTVLVVDDLRRFPPLELAQDVTYARTSAAGLELLRDRVWDEVWLDHDLGEATGQLDDVMPVVDLLMELAYFERPLPTHTVVVHTSNPVGRDTMVRCLGRYYQVRVIDPSSAGSIQDPTTP